VGFSPKPRNFHELADLRRRAETSGGNPVAHEPDSEDEGGTRGTQGENTARARVASKAAITQQKPPSAKEKHENTQG